MGSNVIFYNPYLDRCLRFSWYLDIVMILLLGDASLMFGFDSAMDLDDWNHTLDSGWFDVVRFSDLPHIRCHTGAYSVSVEIYRSSWSCMITPTYKIHAETMTCLLSYHDPPVESLLGHLVRLTLFSIYISSCFFFWEMSIWCLDAIQLWI